jgi:hypothetical protein
MFGVSAPACAYALDEPVPARCSQFAGMARVRSGQAAAWPLVSDRRGYRGSAVKSGRRSFPKGNAKAPLTVEGHPRTLSGPSRP